MSFCKSLVDGTEFFCNSTVPVQLFPQLLRGALMSPTVIVDLSISLFSSHSFWCIYFAAVIWYIYI